MAPACSACLTARQVEVDSLLKEAEVVSVTRLNNEFAEATNVVCY